MKKFITVCFFSLFCLTSEAQEPDEDQLGAWYMYFFNKRFQESPLGIQGDYQFRYWNLGSDLEQLLLRTGITYTPKTANITFTLGYAYIGTGAFGESDAQVAEHRVYQEALMPQKLGSRVWLTHRFRYEQRWVSGQDFRTRYRYNLFINVPLNKKELMAKTLYVALYNELFINGQRSIGGGRKVALFDRNRTYTGLGYGLRSNLRLQLGWMKQITDSWSKGQAQVSLHHTL